ncbi:MAG: PDDEXK nuclease domain-containing protein [Duncaniella sp.]|nr:PDDEXK nuclease domain-containing protein [Duncaniella sp.]
MSKLIKTNPEYSHWIQELKDRYRRSQIKAATQVNREMLHFYWDLGRDIVARDAENIYGSGFYRNLSHDLVNAIPDSKGFSRQNLQYMKKLYLLYSNSSENGPQLAGNSESDMNPQSLDDAIFSIPWGHHRILIDKFYAKRDKDTALFYIHKIIEDGWSRNVLKSFVETNLHMRQGKALTSFSRLLPSPDSDLAQEMTKDPYVFDFTEMTEPYVERELKKALMANISRFLLELGSGFAYVGEEYRLKIGHTEQFIDLLFYNIKLHAYCVIEVKTATFGAGDIGQLGTYMTAVNHILKTNQDNPTIGLLICKDKDNVLAQYALESSAQPIGVAEFRLTKFVPDQFKSSLPSIEDIESELN